MYAGEVSVEHHHVVAGDGQVRERVGAVQGHVDRDALAAQPGPDRAGQNLEVLDDQHSHVLVILLASGISESCGEQDDGRPLVSARCRAMTSGRDLTSASIVSRVQSETTMR